MRRQLADRFSFNTDDARTGGFATVYRGVDLSARPPVEVAVKVLDGAALEVPLLQTFFDREVESLLTLEHENIVELIDAGVDDDGRYFLALEWVDQDLRTWLDQHPELGWEEIVEQIALPLATALAFAHERHVIHRDLKPANVLITGDDPPIPKLADFGISKIKSDLTASSHTTIDFMSRPYSPPEQDSTYSRDVFGFGVLLLGAISHVHMRDYPDIERALAEVDIPADVEDLLRRCVSLTPEQRPRTGVVLFEELNGLMERRRASRKKRTRLHLAFTNTVERTLTESMGLAGLALRKAVTQDLGHSASVRQAQDPEHLGQVDGRQLFLGGDEYSYRAVVQMPAGRPPCLLLVGVQPVRSGAPDLGRNQLLTDFEFTFEQPVSAKAAQANIDALVGSVDAHLAELDLAADERERRRLLDQWRAQLSARQAVEKRKSNPVKYRSYQRRGRRVKFELYDSTASVEVGELRRIELERGGRPPIGEVESADGESIEIRFDEEPRDIPPVGRLVVDNAAASIKIDREKAALLALIHKTADLVEPALRDVIIEPSCQSEPTTVEISSWFRSDLDDDKQDVVRAALGSSGMFAVEGPPGTGKTTFIAELVAQFLERRPSARVLISSQTNVALDNALERVADFVPASAVVRLADRSGSKVADGAKRFLLDAQLESWRERTEQRARSSFDAWCKGHGVSPKDLEYAAQLRQLAQLRDGLSGVAAAIGALDMPPGADEEKRDPDEIEEDRKQLSKRRDLLRRDAREVEQLIAKRAKAEGFDLDKATPVMLRQVARRAFEPLGSDRSRVEVFNAWIQRMGRGEEFIEALLTNARVLGGTCIGIARYRALRSLEFDLCIVDEASKATATETLVPLVRSKRWLLVGDQRQLPPFQEEALADRELIEEFGLDAGELDTTMFDRMLAALPEHSKRSLVVQRRMTEAIGELVSECFYESALQTLGPDPLPELVGVLAQPITWWTTSSIAMRHEVAVGTSLSNPAEVRAIHDILGRLAFALRAGAPLEGLEVLLLAPYSAQVSELRRLVESLGAELSGLQLEVNTIDAVQGREADLVVFSTVRSNPSAKVGFLDSDKRVNVALSRAKRGLIIVGDSVFLSDAKSPLKSVLDFLETHPQYARIEEVSS
ncbi:MAG: AAA domain-containing protein [Acidimicrobiia bacterium]